MICVCMYVCMYVNVYMAMLDPRFSRNRADVFEGNVSIRAEVIFWII